MPMTLADVWYLTADALHGKDSASNRPESLSDQKGPRLCPGHNQRRAASLGDPLNRCVLTARFATHRPSPERRTPQAADVDVATMRAQATATRGLSRGAAHLRLGRDQRHGHRPARARGHAAQHARAGHGRAQRGSHLRHRRRHRARRRHVHLRAAMAWAG